MRLFWSDICAFNTISCSDVTNANVCLCQTLKLKRVLTTRHTDDQQWSPFCTANRAGFTALSPDHSVAGQRGSGSSTPSPAWQLCAWIYEWRAGSGTFDVNHAPSFIGPGLHQRWHGYIKSEQEQKKVRPSAPKAPETTTPKPDVWLAMCLKTFPTVGVFHAAMETLEVGHRPRRQRAAGWAADLHTWHSSARLAGHAEGLGAAGTRQVTCLNRRGPQPFCSRSGSNRKPLTGRHLEGERP